MSKWIVRGVLIAGIFASYNCKRRHNNDDNSNNSANNNNNGNNNNGNNGNNGNNNVANNPQPTPQPQPQMPPSQPQVAPQPTQPGMQPTQPGMQPTQPGESGDLIQSQMTMRQQQFAQGMNPVMPLTRGNLTNSGTQNYAVQMQPGHCYKIIGVGGPTVQDLDLKLYDPNNNTTPIDQDIATDNFPVIGLQHPLCPTAAGAYRLEVVMFTGQGEFGVQVFGN